MSDQHKSIYALTTQMLPGSTHTWTNPKSGTNYTWTVPDDGTVLFYVGETSMPVQERYSKHKTFTRKLKQYLKGEDVIDPHLYPVYFFTIHFCGEDGLDFTAHTLQEGPGLSEADWIASTFGIGHPIQNAGTGSSTTKVSSLPPGPKADYKLVNEQLGRRPKDPEPTPEGIMRARAKWRIEQMMNNAQAKADAWAKMFYAEYQNITEEPYDKMQACIDAYTAHYRAKAQ